MSTNYYLGTTPENSLGNSPRYFYAMRRNDDGELFLVRSDQFSDKESYEINVAGPSSDNFEEFEAGLDFFEGIDANHDFIYPNLKYPQYKWDNRSAFYYVDNNGNLVQRLVTGYNYPTGISSEEN